jgi:hypothetical protein
MFRQHLRLSLRQEKLMENLVDEVLQNFARKSPEFISDNDEESVYKDNDEEKHSLGDLPGWQVGILCGEKGAHGHLLRRIRQE